MLYLDNGATYRGTTLKLCCERLGITPHGSLLCRSPGAVWEDARAHAPAPRVPTEAQLRQAFLVRQRRRLRSDNVLSLDGVLWQTDCGFLAGQVVTVRVSLLGPAPVLEHQGHCYALQPSSLAHPPACSVTIGR